MYSLSFSLRSINITTFTVKQDYKVLPAVIERIKERLRTLPKLDVLSMPFRISFVRVGSYRCENSSICFHIGPEVWF